VSRAFKAHILLVLITLIWGATFVVIKNALADVTPLFFNAIRMSLAAVTLALIFHKDLRRLTAGAIGYGALIGACMWMGNELQTSGLQYTTPSKSAFLTGVAVVLVPVLLALFWKRAINRWSALGIAMAFVGLYLLTVPSFSPSIGRANLESIHRGDLLSLGAAVIFAFHIIFMGHATGKHSWRQIAVVQTSAAALLMIITVPIAEKAAVMWSPAVISGILITGFLSLALSFSVQAWAQQFTPATHTALIFSLEPVFAWLTSFLFLGERLGTRAGLGALLILAGVVTSEEKGSVESLPVCPDHAGVPAGAPELEGESKLGLAGVETR